VSVLKAFECAPALGKTGARAVLQSAGVLHTTTIDELESGAIAKLERLLNDRKSEAK
jgi:ribosomal protein S13